MEYLNMDDDKISFLNKKWKLFLFIFLVITTIFVLSLTISLASQQSSGCKEIKNINDIIKKKTEENNNCTNNFINPFNNNLKIFKDKKYFTSESFASPVNDIGFTNEIITKFKGFSDFKDLTKYDTNFNM